jgi:hypothetical protein
METSHGATIRAIGRIDPVIAGKTRPHPDRICSVILKLAIKAPSAPRPIRRPAGLLTEAVIPAVGCGVAACVEDAVKNLLWMAPVLMISGCSKYYHNPAPQILPQHLRKIAVRPFVNHTRRHGLEDRLTMAVHSAFVRDGRWQIVDENQADGVVIGDITHYILMPLKHNGQQVTTEYKLRVLVDIAFYDMTRNQTLWKEPHLEATLTAPPSSSGLPGGMTEVEAQQKLWDQLAADIATRTFEGFGSVTGASERSVPRSSSGSTPHL